MFGTLSSETLVSKESNDCSLSQFWVKGEYYQYRDYDDFRFNNVDNFVNNEEDEDDVEYVYFGNNQYEDQPNDWDFDEEYGFNTCDIVDDNYVELDFI